MLRQGSLVHVSGVGNPAIDGKSARVTGLDSKTVCICIPGQQQLWKVRLENVTLLQDQNLPSSGPVPRVTPPTSLNLSGAQHGLTPGVLVKISGVGEPTVDNKFAKVVGVDQSTIWIILPGGERLFRVKQEHALILDQQVGTPRV